ncbi:MAG: hypothetical protein ACUVSY_03725 [Roseiflexus sp.]
MRFILLCLIIVLIMTACGRSGTSASSVVSLPSDVTQPPAATAAPGQPLLVTATSPPATTPVPDTVLQPTETPVPKPDQSPDTGGPVPPYNVQPLTPPYGAAMDAQIDAAKQDLAQRLGVAASAVEVVEVDAVTWPDTSLGCPKPGMMYPQVLVEGVLVQLRANGQTYRYHGDGQRRLFLCEEQMAPSGG